MAKVGHWNNDVKNYAENSPLWKGVVMHVGLRYDAVSSICMIMSDLEIEHRSG